MSAPNTQAVVYVSGKRYDVDNLDDIIVSGTGSVSRPWTSPEPMTVQLRNVGPISRPGTEGPAIKYATGREIYATDGKVHRDGDLPAIYDKNLVVEYFVNGLRHRGPDSVGRSQPAIEYLRSHPKYETLMFYRNGKLDRSDGPAIDSYTGTLMYFTDGVLHRGEDLPAVICRTGTMVFFIDGVLDRMESNLPTVICSDGTCMMFRGGKLDRPNGDFPYSVRFVCRTSVQAEDGSMLDVPDMAMSVYDAGEYVSGVRFDYMSKIRKSLEAGDFDIDFWTPEMFEMYGIVAKESG